MEESPTVDDRTRDEILEGLRSVAPHYTDEWDPDADDVGGALLGTFASMAADVIERLNRVPEKHRVAFFDALGFERRPPQPARLPVTFRISDDAEGNVPVPGGTRMVAPAQGGTPEQRFELPEGGGFEGTPANVEAVYTVDPGADDVFDHWTSLRSGRESQLFAGSDLQEHALNIGHAELLNLKSGSRIWVTLATDARAELFTGTLVWEFFGERETADGTAEGWHGLDAELAGSSDRTVTLRLAFPEGPAETAETTVGGIESRWVRCRVRTDDEPGADGESTVPPDVFETEIRAVALSLVPPATGDPGGGGGGSTAGGDGGEPIPPDDLLSGDVPLDVPTGAGDDVDLYPFGETWPLRNAFYVDSEEVFTKGGVPVRLEFAVAPMDGELLRFEDQLSDGRSVVVQAVHVDPTTELSGGAFVVVYAEDNTKLGSSEYLEPGTHESVEVVFDASTPTDETAVTARIHLPDDDEPGEEYENEEGEPAERTAEILRYEGGDPRLSWEYWDGEGWARLSGLEDGTDQLRRSGTVSFTVPGDLEPTTAAGHTGHWIRARLVSGEYLRLTYDSDDLAAGRVSTTVFGAAPRFGGVELRYGVPEGEEPSGDDSGGTGDADGNGPGGTGFTSSPVTGSTGPGSTTRGDPNVDLGEELARRAAGPDVIHGGRELRMLLPVLAGTAGAVPGITSEPDHVVTRNNLAYSDDLIGGLGSGLRPFHGLPDGKATLYVGFDAELRDGPVKLLFSIADEAFPEGFYPRVRWEYRSAVSGEAWTTIETEDGTEGLTRRGIVSLVFPEPTVRTERFGADLHWIRARIDGEAFEPAATDPTEGPTVPPIEVLEIDARNEQVVLLNAGAEPVDLGGYRIEFECAEPNDRVRTFPSEYVVAPHGTRTVSTGIEGADPFEFEKPPLDEQVRNAVTVRSQGGETVTRRVEGEPEPCERWLETVPPAGEPDRSPPVVLGLYPNTGWADNVETVDGELLGSSDGTPGQSFAVASPPVTDEVLRVNELAALSEGEREELLRTDPDRVEESTGPGGEPVAFWVEWTRVEEFRASGATDRHYRLDATAGRFTFGDGKRGRIPPRGADNVRVDYRTGGGAAGNVRAGAVTDLVSTIPFVDGVANPEPGDAGADAETVDAVLARAPKELRDRDRAVSGGDFERLAMAASRKLARVRCIPSMDDAGEYSPGWVTLLIVPDETRPRPVPSVGLKDRVAASVSEHAPATLVAHGGTRPEGTDAPVPELVVRGPSYVEVSVATTLRAGDVGSVSALEAAVVRALDAFLHPLTGGEAGDGWAFGELPCLSDLYALLEGVDGVDHVVDLELTFRGADQSETVSEGEGNPNVAADVLAFGGTHAVAIDGTTGVATARSTTWD